MLFSSVPFGFSSSAYVKVYRGLLDGARGQFFVTCAIRTLMRRRAVASERVGVAVVRSLGPMHSSQDLPRPDQLLNCCGWWEPLSVKPAVVGCWRGCWRFNGYERRALRACCDWRCIRCRCSESPPRKVGQTPDRRVQGSALIRTLLNTTFQQVHR